MDHAKRVFLKATVTVPFSLSVSAPELALVSQLTTTTTPALPPLQDVGGSLAGIDLSLFYQPNDRN